MRADRTWRWTATRRTNLFGNAANAFGSLTMNGSIHIRSSAVLSTNGVHLPTSRTGQ